MDAEFTSPRNERVKRLRRLVRDADARRDEGRCVIEGPRVVGDYLATGLPVELALVAPRLTALEGGSRLGDALARRFADRTADLLRVTDEVLESVSDTRSTQGVALLVPRPLAPGLPRASVSNALLVAWEVGDPGNVGTLCRTAEAAGCAGLVLARDAGPSADPFGPRAIRASAGSAFRLPPVELVAPPAALAARLREAGWRPVACVAAGGQRPEDTDLASAPALVLGSETRGLPDPLVEACASRLTLPLAGRVESLNVGAAGAVVAFEAARQRRLAGRQGSC